VGTTARPLTEAEKETLAPLLRDLHAHVESCAACGSAALGNVQTAADLGASGLCDVGRDLYGRWLKWLARS
jgi:hypothetical protein